jgi:hypothetical protein
MRKPTPAGLALGQVVPPASQAGFICYMHIAYEIDFRQNNRYPPGKYPSIGP